MSEAIPGALAPPAAVAALMARGVVFEEYDLPGIKTVNGIAEIAGNYPSKGVGEKGSWFKDSEGNLLAIGQPLHPCGAGLSEPVREMISILIAQEER